MNKNKIEITENKIIIKDYYTKQEHLEVRMDYGLYKKFGTARHPNRYKGPFSYSGNIMNWAYNNPYQPHADANKRTNQLMGYIDGSGANWPATIGSMKEIWKDFEDVEKLRECKFEELDVRKIENNWWDFFINIYRDNFEKGVYKLETYINEKRSLFTEEERRKEKRYCEEFSDDEIWKIGCRDYMQYLIRTSARGFIMELILFTILKSEKGFEYIESTKEDEKKGIDGYVVKDGNQYAICLKPETFHGGVSPVYKDRMVFYNRSTEYNKQNDLIFRFRSGYDILAL